MLRLSIVAARSKILEPMLSVIQFYAHEAFALYPADRLCE